MIKKNDNFTIYCSSVLNSEDVRVLSLLYAPLISGSALQLYLTLSSLAERSNLSSYTAKHQILLDALMLNAEELYNVRIKLEAIGLLTTLVNNDKFIYLLKSPLTAKQFLIDGALGTFLYSQVGAQNYKVIEKMFNIATVDKSNFVEITKSFDEVFQSDIEVEKKNNEDYILGRNQSNGLNLTKFNFEYKRFLSLISTIIDKRKASSKKLETYITNTAFAYGFDIDVMANMYRQSIDNELNLDYQLFAKNCKEEFQFQYNKALPKITENKEDQMYVMLKEITAKELLTKFTKRKMALPDDVTTLSKIYQEFENIDRAILNLAILNVLKLKEEDDFIPAYNYFKKAINTLLTKNIRSFSEAKEYFYGDKQKYNNSNNTNKNNYTKNSTKKKEPDWLDDHINNIMEGVEVL